MSSTNAFQKLKLLILDVEGVLTDGLSWQDSEGSWRRYFSVRDTIGIRAIRRAGLLVAVVSSSDAPDITDHLAFVGVDECVSGCVDKLGAIRSILAKRGLEAEEVAFMSSDSFAAEAMSSVGCAFAAASAPDELKAVAAYVTCKVGGDGAVLEICNLILKALQHQGTLRPARTAGLRSVSA